LTVVVGNGEENDDDDGVGADEDVVNAGFVLTTDDDDDDDDDVAAADDNDGDFIGDDKCPADADTFISLLAPSLPGTRGTTRLARGVAPSNDRGDGSGCKAPPDDDDCRL
jgi:hypothetical protein